MSDEEFPKLFARALWTVIDELKSPLSRRDEFAVAALTGLLAAQVTFETYSITQMAVSLADDMIKELDK